MKFLRRLPLIGMAYALAPWVRSRRRKTRTALLSFANLLEIASSTAPPENCYSAQDELVERYREMRRPFLAKMPYRSLYICTVCCRMSAEAALHFEDPGQPLSESASLMDWGTPVGRYVDIYESKFHHILRHGEKAPPALAELFASVSREPSPHL